MEGGECEPGLTRRPIAEEGPGFELLIFGEPPLVHEGGVRVAFVEAPQNLSE